MPTRRLKNVAAEASSEEKEWLSTLVGIIKWIARSCGPTLSYNVSKLQGRSRKLLVGDIKICNQVIRYTLETSEDGIYCHHGFDWSNMISGYVGDASVAEEDQSNYFTHELKHHRSQGGKTIIFASKELMAGTDVFFSCHWLHQFYFAPNSPLHVSSRDVQHPERGRVM